MLIKKLIASLIVCLVLLVAGFAVVTADEQGTITGQVTNQTTNVKIPDLKVTLFVFEKNTEKPPVTAQADSAGNFTFTGLNTSPDYTYILTATYNDVNYESEPANFPSSSSNLTLNLSVYDSTSSGDSIKVSQGHLVLYFNESTILAGQFILIQNGADKTFVGTSSPDAGNKKATLRFTLPADAGNVYYHGRELGESFYVNGDQLVDTAPIPPGETQLIITYELPYKPPTHQLAVKIDYPTDNLRVLVQDVGAKATSSQLQSRGVVDGQGGKYVHLEGNNFKAGSELLVDLSNIPSKLPTTGTRTESILGIEQTTFYQSAAGIVALALLLFVFVYWRQRQAQTPRPKRVAARPSRLANNDMRAIIDLASLDESFASGKITREEYMRQRAERKAKLLGELKQRETKDAGRDSEDDVD